MHSTDISRFQVARELLGTFWYLTSLSQIPQSKKEVAEKTGIRPVTAVCTTTGIEVTWRLTKIWADMGSWVLDV